MAFGRNNKELVARQNKGGGYDVTDEIDWSSIDTQIRHEGKEIILPGDPANMEYDDAIATIARVRDQENQKFDVNELVKGAPWDATVATYRALQQLYGAVTVHGTKSWFGEINPDFLTVDTGPRPEDKIQVPMGAMRVPNFDDMFTMKIDRLGCRIVGSVRKKDRARMIEIANLARQILSQESVYRGKAISLNVDDNGNLILLEQPTFMEIEGVQETDIIHRANTQLLIDTTIFGPMKNTAACRKHRIPLRRGILLEGRYGCGKSLTALVSAKVATDNAWTFINLKRSQGLKAAIEFAKNYQPCVIFAEDIDRCADRSEEGVNDLVNMMDGVLTKSMEVMVVMTTNHLDKIDQALLRPGRFDAIISILPPDADAAEKLMRHYSRDLLDSKADLTEVGKLLDGQIPATIREVVERSKLFGLTMGRENITAEDLKAAALAMTDHMKLLEPKDNIETPADKLFKGMTAACAAGNVLAGGEEGEALQGSLERMQRNLMGSLENISDGVGRATTAATVAAIHSGDAARNSGGGSRRANGRA